MFCQHLFEVSSGKVGNVKICGKKTGFFDQKLFWLNQIFILQHCYDSWRRIKAACHACAQLTSYRTAFWRKNNEQAVSQQLTLPSSFGLLSDSIQLSFFLVIERLRVFVWNYCVCDIGQKKDKKHVRSWLTGAFLFKFWKFENALMMWFTSRNFKLLGNIVKWMYFTRFCFTYVVFKIGFRDSNLLHNRQTSCRTNEFTTFTKHTSTSVSWSYINCVL